MRNIFKAIFLISIFLSLSYTNSLAQNRIDSIRQHLSDLSEIEIGLSEEVEFSLEEITLQELLRLIANAHNLNVSIDPSLQTIVSNNFSGVPVEDVLVFLCENYNLDINFYGAIMSFVPYKPQLAPISKSVPKEISITSDSLNSLITMDLNNDTLSKVIKKLTEVTSINFVYSPQIADQLISAYFKNAAIGDVLQNLAESNALEINPAGANFYSIEALNKPGFDKNGTGNQMTQPGTQTGLYVKTASSGLVNVSANESSIAKLIEVVASEMEKDFYLFTQPKGNITLNIENSRFEDFLDFVLSGSDFTYRYEKGLYLIGDRNQEGLRLTEILQLQYRTVDKVIDLIPADMKKDVEIKVFPDLNSLILSGSEPNINELRGFLLNIDKLVPVIQIEVIIVDVRNTYTISTGIEAGVSDQPTPTQGTIFPGVDVTLSSSSVNELIGLINGLGFVNLGKVAPNFYLSLKFLEDQGYLKVRSTPKLATLNGTEASLTIGRTEYYLETQNNVIGSQNPQNIITEQFKPISANLSVKIKPIVSGDDQITLEVDMSQESFTERISKDAPPGNISRQFKSLIRIKNEEMIVLGGLEENSNSDTGHGTPFLSRVPIIKWLFSSRTKATSKNKLIIFIKPTVIY